MERSYTFRAVATVHNERHTKEDDHWNSYPAVIELSPELPDESLNGIDGFSHLEILFHFDRLDRTQEVNGERHPRDDRRFPKAGIFAQRGAGRPNRIGATIVRLVKREGRKLFVEGLDALDGTPVLDIKPVMREFLPEGPVEQPSWVSELMKAYW